MPEMYPSDGNSLDVEVIYQVTMPPHALIALKLTILYRKVGISIQEQSPCYGSDGNSLDVEVIYQVRA